MLLLIIYKKNIVIIKKAAKKIETNSPRINFSLIEVGIGTVFGALILGVARNLLLKGQLFSYAILGFAFSEATGLFALMMVFLLLYVAYMGFMLTTFKRNLYRICLSKSRKDS